MQTDSHLAGASNDPPALTRHPFELWLFERRISQRKAAERLGISNTWLGRFLLPPEDVRYVRPSPELRQAIREMTDGEIGEDRFPAPAGQAAEPEGGQ